MYLLIGLFVGAIGTLVGAGGGFILMPIFFYLFPEKSVVELTSISLAVVFLNACSGSVSYVRKKRVDFKSALIFSAAAIPGAISGVFVTQLISRRIFDPIFGVLLCLVGLYLYFNPVRKPHESNSNALKGKFHRQVTDSEGKKYLYSFNLNTGIIVSIFIGFLASLLGIGGGIIHVPLMSLALDFPILIATATSHLILVITSLVGTITHLINRDIKDFSIIITMAPGVVIGAQIGAKLSNKVKGAFIVKTLALAIVLVGIRLIYFNLRVV